MVAFNSAQNKLINFFPAGDRVEISNFTSWFCLKGKLLELKSFTGVSNTETL